MSRLSIVALEAQVLKELAVGSKNGGLVWNELMPIVSTPTVVGSIPKFGKESFVHYTTRRALGGGANSARMSMYDKVAYELKGYNFEYVADELEIKASNYVDLAKKGLTDAIAAIELSREIEVATLATTAANYASTNKVAYSDNYLNEAAVDPIAALQTACDAIENESGIYPNRIIMDSKVWQKLRQNTKIADTYFPNNSSQLVTVEAVAGLLGIEKIVIAKGRYLSSKDDTTLAPVWGNNIVIAYVAAPQGDLAPSEYTPSYGYVMEEESGRTEYNIVDPRNLTSTFGCSLNFTPVVTGIIAGYLISTPIDPALF